MSPWIFWPITALGGRFFGSWGTFFWIQGDVFWDPGGWVFGYTLSLGWVILLHFFKKIMRFGTFYIYLCHQKTSLNNIYNYHFFWNCPFNDSVMVWSDYWRVPSYFQSVQNSPKWLTRSHKWLSSDSKYFSNESKWAQMTARWSQITPYYSRWSLF